MKSIKLSLSAIVILFSTVLMAGGINVAPGFYKSYLENENVVQAENGNLDGRIANHLIDDDVTIDVKAAIIDALASSGTWNVNNVETFKMFLGRKTKMSFKDLDYDKLSADDLFILGYLMFVDESASNDEALNLLEMAKTKSPKSQTINLIYMLAKVNAFAEKAEWCTAKELINSVKADNTLVSDMKADAVETILGSVAGVSEKCK